MVTQAMASCLALLNSNGDGRSEGLAGVPPEEVSAALGVNGAAVSVRGVHGATTRVWGDDPVSAGLADLQLTLGEGPVLDSSASDTVVLQADLLTVPVARWPVFTAEAVALGVRAVFALPLRLGVIRVGTLVLHRDMPGALGVAELGDALTFADGVTLTLLIENETRSGGETDSFDAEHGEPIGGETVVYQASGMISVQLEVSMAEALVRLRAYAYGNSRPTGEVAADVVARRLRFDDKER